MSLVTKRQKWSDQDSEIGLECTDNNASATLHSNQRGTKMAKHNALAITEAAKQAGRQLSLSGLAGRRVAALMAKGEEIASRLPNGQHRSLQAVCSDGTPFSALIKQGNTVIQIEGTNFAVSTHD